MNHPHALAMIVILAPMIELLLGDSILVLDSGLLGLLIVGILELPVPIMVLLLRGILVRLAITGWLRARRRARAGLLLGLLGLSLESLDLGLQSNQPLFLRGLLAPGSFLPLFLIDLLCKIKEIFPVNIGVVGLCTMLVARRLK